MSDSDDDATIGRPAVPGDGWAMGAVARRTGLGEHTLRAWERRFGFPRPQRLASGHRRYPDDQVVRLLLIARALAHGCRAGDVVPLPLERLRAVVRTCEDHDEQAPQLGERAWVDEVVTAARRLDPAAVVALLRLEAVRLGLPRFLRERLGPLLVEVGDGWTRETVAIRHEHLLSEQVDAFLRAERAALELRAGGRPVVLATLPGEAHLFGVHVAALEVVLRGRAVLVLGGQLPAGEVAAAAAAVGAAAVAVSVSLAAAPVATEALLAELRAALAPATRLWVGGGGAIALDLPAGADLVATLDALVAALAGLAAGEAQLPAREQR